MITKTQYKFIEFVETKTNPDFPIADQRKFPWVCLNRKSKDALGYVCKQWNQWCFIALEGTVLSVDCMEDIIHFLKQAGATK